MKFPQLNRLKQCGEKTDLCVCVCVCVCVSVLPVSVQGEAALHAVHGADREESGVLLWTLSADEHLKQGTVHQLHTC